MAVMTTQQPEGVAFEQKIQPVPSSDKMALDLDINGDSIRDETLAHNHVDDVPAPDVSLTKSAEPTSVPDNAVAEAIPISAPVNGVSNTEALAESQAIVAPLADLSLPVESQATEETSSAVNSSQLPDTNTTTAEEQAISAITDHQEPDAAFATTESAIETAVEDVAAPTSVPPVVEAQESALRDTSSPAAPSDTQPVEQQPTMDFSFDSAVELPQEDNIVDRTAAEQASGLEFSEALPDIPDLSANNESVQQASTDFAADDSLNLESGNNAITGSNAEVSEAGTDSSTAQAGVPDPATDVSVQSVKVAREREDDDETEPSAKRTKTEDTNNLDHEMGDVPQAPALDPNGESVAVQTNATSLSEYQTKEIIKILKNTARTKDGKNFREPVVKLWPTIAEPYLAKISNPIDLLTMEQKVRESAYPSLDAVKDDAKLIASNATTFNGPDHAVTASANVVVKYFTDKLEAIPPEPAPAAKKEKKVKKEPSTDVAPRTTARRPSRGAATTAQPPAAPPTQTFALDPTTSTPLIRRDSTKVEGGRPKREIHPPKNKDLPYSVPRPKNKKFATELKFCETVFKELNDSKHRDIAHPFYVPVDPVALGIPNYFAVIKSPMDLTTIGNKLREHNYATAKDFEKDVRLIIANCYKFNPPGNPVRSLGQQFEQLFNEQWGLKQQWIAEHSPAAASPAGDDDSEEEESEEEEEEVEVPSAAGSGQSPAALRLIEEQGKLIQMMKNKADKVTMDMQQGIVDMVEAIVKKESQAKSAPAAKKTKKPKAPKAKKPAPVKKAPASKKTGASGGGRHKYMGTLEKEVISAGIGQLPDEISNNVLGWIKAEQPGVDVSDDGTLELDIDLVSVPTLWKIHGLIMLHCPEVESETRKQFVERDTPRELAKPPSKKKNKPMSKSEQEQKIELLRNRANEFAARQASGSQEPVMQTVESTQTQPDSSGDEDSDSEEE